MVTVMFVTDTVVPHAEVVLRTSVDWWGRPGRRVRRWGLARRPRRTGVCCWDGVQVRTRSRSVGNWSQPGHHGRSQPTQQLQ